MNLSRRSFLGGVIAVVGTTTFLPTVPQFIQPALWGDGIHDDYEGLQALFNREPVTIMNDCARVLDSGDELFLNNGCYKVTRGLIVPEGRWKFITSTNNHWNFSELTDEYGLFVKEENSRWVNEYLESPRLEMSAAMVVSIPPPVATQFDDLRAAYYKAVVHEARESGFTLRDEWITVQDRLLSRRS